MKNCSLLSIAFAAITGCAEPESVMPEPRGVLVSWNEAIDTPLPCVIVSTASNVEAIEAIGEGQAGCGGPRAFIIYSPANDDLSTILSFLPSSPASDVGGRPWHLLIMRDGGSESARLSVEEALALFRGIANASPDLREEMEFRLIGRMEARLGRSPAWDAVSADCAQKAAMVELDSKCAEDIAKAEMSVRLSGREYPDFKARFDDTRRSWRVMAYDENGPPDSHRYVEISMAGELLDIGQ
jgi:hypothetical protein